MTRRKLICLTPVKDEAWILERFLKCASLWADHIIIADQDSSDNSRQIAGAFEKVILIRNPSEVFNEPDRQKLLIAEARKIPGPKILLALDADEILSGNWSQSQEWRAMMSAPEGTVIRFQLANILPDLSRCWIPPIYFRWGFVDDGKTQHTGRRIHSARIPLPKGAPSIFVKDIKMLHYQYTDWERMRSKHRWYQAWEMLHNNRNSAVSLYRGYHHMYSVKPSSIARIREEWFAGYEALGVDMRSVCRDERYRWDREILKMFSEHGAGRFAKLAIWDIDWRVVAERLGYENASDFIDPRNKWQKMLHGWLKGTQPDAKSLNIRLMDRILKLLGL